MNYQDFIKSKLQTPEFDGVIPVNLPKVLKPFQQAAVRWSLRRRRSALFAGTGLGKTLKQLVWSQVVSKHEDGPILIAAPLAVVGQTLKEANKFGIKGVVQAISQKEAGQITVTNYDRLDRFDVDKFCGIVLDESSICKHTDSKTRMWLTDAFVDTPWKLCCTATPAPNDFMELGNHAEFLGVCTQAEMLAEFFVHEGAIRAGLDAGEDWRLKRHAEKAFWEWLSTWALVYNSPEDLGFDEPDYKLPELKYHLIEVDVERKPQPGQFFASGKPSLRERISLRGQTVDARARAAVELIQADAKSAWVVWCGRNDEANLVERLLKDARQVSGSTERNEKIDTLLGFVDGDPRIIVTKPSIAGFGMNWQHCHKMVFVGLNDSFEQLYQAIRRCWRFGQEYPVEVWLVSSSAEYAVLQNVMAKEQRSTRMYTYMKELSAKAVVSSAPINRRIIKSSSFKGELPAW